MIKRDNKILYHVILSVIVIILYYSTFVWLFNVWLSEKEYSHGFIIPFVSLFLIWNRRDCFSQINTQPSVFAGVMVLIVGVFLLLAGHAGGYPLIKSISFLIIIPGLILFLGGWEYLKAFALPIGYLQFMIPWMEDFIDRIHWPFQLLSAKIGVWTMQILGFAVYQEGKFIQLPYLTLEVAVECSGIKFLLSVIALGIPLVYITQKTWPRAIGVIASGIVITILANGGRVALAGIMAYSYGSKLLHGPFHIFQGWFVAQVGFIALFLVNIALCRIPTPNKFTISNKWKKNSNQQPNTISKPVDTIRISILALFLILVGVYMYLFTAPRSIPLARSLKEIPASIGEWRGNKSDWIKGENYFPGADSEIVYTYRNKYGKEIQLYIGYFETQKQGKSLINYHANPLREKIKAVEINSKIDTNSPWVVNKSLPLIDHKKYEAVFWYRLPSGEYIGRYSTKIKSVLDALLSCQNNGAVILIATDYQKNGLEEYDSVDLNSFASELKLVLKDFLP